jgi:hypothetical protein
VAVTELTLLRSPDDRRVLMLEGVGTLRIEGLNRKRATAEAGGRRYSLRGRLASRGVDVSDEQGAPAGSYEQSPWHGGGVLEVRGQELRLRMRAGLWSPRYAVVNGGCELAVLQRRRSLRPLVVTVDDGAALDPLVLLLALFVARRCTYGTAAAPTFL